MFVALGLHVLPHVKRLCLLMLLVGCSHDAKRENPFDPALTPAVELRVVAIGTTGTTQLDWSPYQGDTPFAP